MLPLLQVLIPPSRRLHWRIKALKSSAISMAVFEYFSLLISPVLACSSFQRLPLDYEHTADHCLAVFGLLSYHTIRTCNVLGICGVKSWYHLADLLKERRGN
jgi:hypothetical protein